MKLAVVGAGISGANTAQHLAQRGHQVTLFDQFPVGHDRGSSHGRSRIVRRAYPDAFYTACMEQAYPMWAELDRLAGGGILHECGLLYYGQKESPTLQSVFSALEELSVPFSTVDAGNVAAVFPRLTLSASEVGAFTPEAGWVAADRAVAASIELAERHGAMVVQRRIESVESLEAGFDAFVLCAGAWTKRFVPLPVTVSLQTFGYVDAGSPMTGPVWIEDGAVGFYGFPSEPGATTIKVGVHQRGPEIDPENPERELSAATLELIRSLARARFGLEDAPMLNAKGCLYSSTATEDFIVGRIGSKGFFVTACSGHGFKFGPWIGKLMADFIDRTDEPERHPRFFLK